MRKCDSGRSDKNPVRLGPLSNYRGTPFHYKYRFEWTISAQNQATQPKIDADSIWKDALYVSQAPGIEGTSVSMVGSSIQIEGSLNEMEGGSARIEGGSRPALAGKPRTNVVRAEILEALNGRWMTTAELAAHLGRDPKSLAEKHFSKMLKEGLIERRYEEASHPQQAYRASQGALFEGGAHRGGKS